MSTTLQLELDNHLLIIHPDNRNSRSYADELIANNSLFYSRVPATNLVFNYHDSIGDCEFSPDIYVLDECDKLHDETLNDLLLHLNLCDPLIIIILSRTLPFALLENDNLRPQIQIISDTGLVSPQNTGQPTLEISGFGIGRVRVNGRDIALIPGELDHELFFYLIENFALSRDDILMQFWSHLDQASAVINFHTTLKRLNNLLGFKLMQLTGTHYRLNPDIIIRYDVQSFRDILQNIAYGNTMINRQAYESAYQLYHHDFLIGTDAAWAIVIRDNLRAFQSDVCFNLADLSTKPGRAFGLYNMAFHYNPYREDTAHAIMTFYLNDALPCDALDVYDAIADNLMQRYGIAPARNLRNLMQQAKAQCNR